jgi:hypothetical protein
MIDRVGRDLNARYGKKRHYSQSEIHSAASSNGYAVDLHCWAYCVFMDSPSFHSYHQSIGETCDYDAMRTTMLESLGPNLGFALPTISWPNLEMPQIGLPHFEMPQIEMPEFSWPEIDLSSFFDWS